MVVRLLAPEYTRDTSTAGAIRARARGREPGDDKSEVPAARFPVSQIANSHAAVLSARTGPPRIPPFCDRIKRDNGRFL